MGIEMTFAREERAGTRMIRISVSNNRAVSTVSKVSAAYSEAPTSNSWPGPADGTDGADHAVI
jgi:hypothetical protein